MDYSDLFLMEEFHLLEGLVAPIDVRLDQIDEAVRRCPDPDGWGCFDSADAVCGLGFVAIQTFIVSTAAFSGVKKGDALKLGPHRSGKTVAESVNHAANWWKHCDEWQLGEGGNREAREMEGLRAIGVPVDDGCHVLLATLARLVSPQSCRFNSLLPLINDWRAALHERFPPR